MKKVRPLFFFSLCLIIGLTFLYLEVNRQVMHTRTNLHDLLVNQSLQLKNDVSENINLVYSLRALVQGSNGNSKDLDKYGPTMLVDKPKIRNILLAPNAVVDTVYPLESNASVIGLNLLANENKSAAAAIKARNSKDVILTGPYDLKQGGSALSGRLAIFLLDENGQERYWGLASVSVDYPKVFDDTSLNILKTTGYSYRFYNKESNTTKPLLSNHPDKLNTPEKITFFIYNMEFDLEASPLDGWYDKNFITLGLIAIIGISLLLSYIFTKILESSYVLKEKASKDALTGLYNRTAAFKQIDALIQQQSYEHGAFVIIDIDNFKSINDFMGHQFGDKVLLDFAQVLKSNCRDSDILGRLGGDEFILYLPYNGSQDFLTAKLNKILKNVFTEISYSKKHLTVSASMGVSFLTDQNKTLTSLYALADKALYSVKAGTKNDIAYADQNNNSL